MVGTSDRAGSAEGARRRASIVMLIVVALVVFASLGLGRFGYSVVLPSMQADLDLTNTQTGMLATGNLIGYLVMAVLSGALAAHFGARRVIALGLALAGMGMVLSAALSSFPGLLISRTLTGGGSAAANVPAMGLLAAWFGPERRGRATGVGVTGSSVALILLGPGVPMVLDHFPEAGWRLCWLAFACITLVLAVVVPLCLQDPADDAAGTAPHAGGSARPRLMDVYGSLRVWHLGAVYAAFGFSYIIYLTFFVRHLTGELGLSRETAGAIFMLLGWASLLCGVLWGALSDRIGRRGAMMLVFAMHAVAFGLFGTTDCARCIVVSALLFGLSAWSIPAIITASCADVVEARLAPAALGFVTLLLGVGQAFGPGVAGMLADAFGSFRPAFWLAAGVATAGILGAWSLPRHAGGGEA